MKLYVSAKPGTKGYVAIGGPDEEANLGPDWVPASRREWVAWWLFSDRVSIASATLGFGVAILVAHLLGWA